MYVRSPYYKTGQQFNSSCANYLPVAFSQFTAVYLQPTSSTYFEPQALATLSHWCSGMSAHLIKVIWQSYTFMSRIFSLPHERALQRILMRFIFVINVRNNEPPEQLGYRQKHPTTKPASYLVADMV